MTPAAPFGREEIEKILPHRDPFLLIDEVLELDPGKRVVARRYLRAEDWWFTGHFPARPVMPGVLTVEAMAQAGAVAVLADPGNHGKLPFFAGIDGCKFKRIVEPGDTLTLECEFVRIRGPVARGNGVARVGDEIAAHGVLTVFVAE
ncbi:MAG: 3-hydroxyacyl-ACP dehydratase FabZ [Gaiellaceae bacterium]